MFRKIINSEISDYEYDTYQKPQINRCAAFLEEFIIPEYVAFYLASGYFHDSIWECSFSRHFNSISDMFNHSISDKNKVIENTKKILELKYSLKIVQEEPLLEFKKI